MPIIYALTCKDRTKIYFGSTASTKEDRFLKHKHSWNSWKNGRSSYCASFELFEIGEVEIHLVMDCPDVYEVELRKIEQIYLDNCECVNIMNAYQSEEEYKKYMKEYSQKNKERITEHKQKYAKSEKGILSAERKNQKRRENRLKLKIIKSIS